jgi:CrcB protein
MWQTYVVVGLGGGLGAVSRYVLSTVLMERFNGALPWGTLAVNLLGSLFLGFFHEYALARTTLTADMRMLVSVGFLGAFTTFSTFARETVLLLQERQLGAALLYSGGSLIAGTAMVLVGMIVAGAVSTR